MAYFENELGAFIAIEGDHFDAIMAEPRCIDPALKISDDAENGVGLAPNFETLMNSTGADRDAFMMVAVSDGWTFIGTIEDFPIMDLEIAASLAKKFHARTFQMDFSHQYVGGNYIFFNEDGSVLRFVDRVEVSEESERTEIGNPLDIEKIMVGDWYTPEVLALFHAWGGPDRANEENWQKPMEKVAWLEYDYSQEIEPDPERERLASEISDQKKTVYPMGPPPARPKPVNPIWMYWLLVLVVGIAWFVYTNK